MIHLQPVKGVPIRLWVPSGPAGYPQVEEQALQQLRNVAQLPFVHRHGVCAMPDVHLGVGATVGSVIATHRAIIPAAVGVDIGCGMNAVRTSLTASDLPDSLGPMRAAIERAVPLGAGGRTGLQGPALDSMMRALPARTPTLDARLPGMGQSMDNIARQVGTLGSGNHFIEVCLDEKDQVWILLHSGSRGVGNKIGMHFIAIAKREMEQYFISLPDKDLAYLVEGTTNFGDYVEAVGWAQDFATLNREIMMMRVIEAVRANVKRHDFTAREMAISCHHNYVEKEHHFGSDVWTTRKGAVRARSGDLGIIPGSMGQRSYIVRGKGNPASYHSCSHGAGRAMSRTAARAAFTVEDLARQTEGVECRKDDGVLDEIPGAYKDIDEVMEQQRDLIDVIATLKQVLNVKG